MSFAVLAALAAFAGGTVASIAGFGIGSIVTPLLAMRYGMKLAVAAVAIPHFFGTTLRMVFLRRELDRHVMLTFGVTSAIGGLAGALLHIWLQGRVLTWVLATLLVYAGISGLLGITPRFGKRSAWVAGALSGMLGGLVGNQGGIRAGAMMGFDVRKEAFVATSTAVGLFVDVMRVPVYLATEGRALLAIWPIVAIMTVAVLVGTLFGRLLLGRIPDAAFRKVVSGMILLLGVSMFVTA
jgi:uncharacterized protein